MKACQLLVSNSPKVSSSSSFVKGTLRSIDSSKETTVPQVYLIDCRWNSPMLMHNHSLNIVHFGRSGCVLAVHFESGNQSRKKISSLSC